MGCAEAIRGVDGIAWPGKSGLNNAKPRSGGRQPGLSNPPQAKTPAEALSYIELLYKSGRMEDLAKLLRKSQVFRVAWLILQQSAPGVSEAAGKGHGSLCRGKREGPASLPVPASGPQSLSLEPGPESSGAKVPGVANTEFSPPVPAVRLASDGANDAFASRSQAAHPLNFLLQAYQNQEDYWARERQRGQMVSIRA
jgi:hypothetical protein